MSQESANAMFYKGFQRAPRPTPVDFLLYNLWLLRCRCVAWLALQERCPRPDYCKLLFDRR